MGTRTLIASRPRHSRRVGRDPRHQRDRTPDGTVTHGLGLAGLVWLMLWIAPACAGPTDASGRSSGPTLRYVGSSTIAHFIREADQRYGQADFTLDTAPESSGGEAALLAGRADIAGVARPPSAEVLSAGVSAIEIGRDAIAIVVHPQNPVADLSRQQLSDIFSGQVRNWSQVGGPQLPIQPFVVGPESATRYVFRSAVLGQIEYAGCQVVRPDEEILASVSAHPGAIGQISISFLAGATNVKAIAVDGQPASVTNFDYPITRPLFLLWREGRPVLDAFAAWVLSEPGQKVVMGHFVGNRVIASVPGGADRSSPPRDGKDGHLLIYTDTDTVYDGGIYYYPHLAYEVLSRTGEFIRRVRNHRGDNDESPTRVSLRAGTYWIRAETAGRKKAEFFVTIVADETTTVSVAELLEQQHEP